MNPLPQVQGKGTTVTEGVLAGAPAYFLYPAEKVERCVLVLHGYGGSKEEMLALGLSLSRAGWAACLPDLPGHGAHPLPLTGDSARAFAAELKKYSFAAVVGHSLGGRIALHLGRKPLCLLSVPREACFAGRKSELLALLRARRVREARPYAGLEEALAALEPLWPDPPVLLLHGSRDLPTCLAAAQEGCARGWEVAAIRGAGHLDILWASESTAILISWLKRWLKCP